MQYSLVLMRHAQSTHNFEKTKWKSEHKQSPNKNTPEYQKLKFNPELIDSNIIVREQLHIAKHEIDLSKVQVIICSPLRRCLETCRQLIKGREQEFHVVVEPLLSSRLSAAWSIGSSSKQLKEEYPWFDFSALGQQECWMINILQNIRTIEKQEMKNNLHRMTDYLLRQLINGKGETYLQFFRRCRRLKQRLQHILQHYNLKDESRKDVIIISHSCVLNCLLGREINEKGKMKDKISFDHCSPRRYDWSQVMKLYPSTLPLPKL